MIKLSVSEKGFGLFKDGTLMLSRGYSYTNKRDAILRNIQRGVLQCGNYVEHEDLLIIEVGDSYSYKWLCSDLPNKSNIENYSATHMVLDSLICRYRFTLSRNPSVNNIVLQRPKVETSNFSLGGN
jgi:hypothetical protein